jgi:hypothetical protein
MSAYFKEYNFDAVDASENNDWTFTNLDGTTGLTFANASNFPTAEEISTNVWSKVLS